MKRFTLDDKDFDSCKADVPKTGTTLEIMKTGTDEYTVFTHQGDHVTELGVYTKQEMKILWRMLSID